LPIPKRTLRDRRKEETRQLLEETARRLFSKQGFRATSIDQIATEAGVSRTTYFRYFDSKEAVIFASQDQMTEVFWKQLEERPPEENALRAFEEAFVAFARTSEANPAQKQRSLEVWALYAANPELRARLAETTQRRVGELAKVMARREGLDEPAPVHTVASTIAIDLVQQVNEDWQRANGEIPAEGLIRERFRLLRELAAG
jgi:AcrR family transcriptional regulator